MPEIVNIRDEIARLDALGVLKPLLADKSTGGNILWATDAYAERGPRYAPDAEITQDLITSGENAGIIQTRAQKALEQQSARTRRRAEVYTPLWVCRTMCDHLDEIWFRRKEGFNRLDPATGRVRFPKNRTWTAYVKSTRMEITCGEGPFLTSRYDAPTGTLVLVRERVGLLDRKLRAVSENTDNETDWLKWAARAFQSSYGYEFQGDSLLIARVNALMTFAEYFSDRWGRFPGADKCKAIADIIAWNLWQMDGLTDAIPYRTLEKYEQTYIAGWLVSQVSVSETPKRCHIYDWRKECDAEYASLKEGGEKAVKFDFIIGNPPYQEEAPGDSTSDKPIYHTFMSAAYEVGDKVELITPARFLFNAGATPKEWNKSMLSNPHVKVMKYESNADKIFPNTAITGGIAITYYDKFTEFKPIHVFIPFDELREITNKVSAFPDFKSLSALISGRTPYLFTDIFHKEHPNAKELLSKGHMFDISSNAFVSLPDVFSCEKPDNEPEYYRVLGRLNNERTYCWIPKKYARGRLDGYVNHWKVFLPKANGASGMLGANPARLISKPVLGEPNDIATDTFLCIAPLGNKSEADAVLKYLNSKFARVLLGTLKVTQINSRETWSNVPIQDFTSQSDIDWSKSVSEIDRQLYAKYNLDEKEIAFIESHVKAME